jgi:alcohol dehydrogenase (cytochrome c)
MKPTYAALLFCTLLSAQAITLAQDKASDQANDWPLYHRSSEAWRHSPLKQINAANVSKLKVAWTHTPIDSSNGLLATPIVVSDVVYYSDSRNNVYALDGTSGKEIWRYQ